jgi:hypothetical protein
LATREQVYEKFGITAEAAQLLETELSTLMIGIRGLENDWHITGPDREVGRRAVEEIDGHTLGAMLKKLKGIVQIDDFLAAKLTSALKARNRLIHGFYERHNFKIDDEIGRDAMIADLEKLHEELFQAWQIAGGMTATFMKILFDLKERAVGVSGIGDYLAEFSATKAARKEDETH